MADDASLSVKITVVRSSIRLPSCRGLFPCLRPHLVRAPKQWGYPQCPRVLSIVGGFNSLRAGGVELLMEMIQIQASFLTGLHEVLARERFVGYALE